VLSVKLILQKVLPNTSGKGNQQEQQHVR